ncbi:MAG: NRDE family protein [Moraxellaceae bacterium]|nr:NRDE family protein [Moraxellaceae bacterium]MBP9730438.1 NRDE family protein [Moraxellaceae bacterium]
MCLIAVAWQTHPDYPLMVLANRDEFYDRPAASAQFWEESPDVLAGRDLSAGGAWLGVTRQGRFAALTNVREPGMPLGVRSRGEVVSAYLLGNESPAAYSERVKADGGHYSGFNLLASDGDSLWWSSNREADPRQLGPGIYLLSNHLLDTPWPKVKRLRAGLMGLLPQTNAEAMLALLQDGQAAADSDLPDTGIGLAMERLLSPAFIRTPQYGTRASTLVMAGHDRIGFIEQGYGPDGLLERSEFAFDRQVIV